MSNIHSEERKKLINQLYRDFYSSLLSNNCILRRSCGCIEQLHRYNPMFYPSSSKITKFYENILPNSTGGNIIKLEVGRKSVIIYSMENCQIMTEGDIIKYLPIDENRIMKINGIPIRYIIRFNTQNSNPQYNEHRYLIQLDDSELRDKIIKNRNIRHLIRKLRRDYNSYFSFLPKELIRVITIYYNSF